MARDSAGGSAGAHRGGGGRDPPPIKKKGGEGEKQSPPSTFSHRCLSADAWRACANPRGGSAPHSALVPAEEVWRRVRGRSAPQRAAAGGRPHSVAPRSGQEGPAASAPAEEQTPRVPAGLQRLLAPCGRAPSYATARGCRKGQAGGVREGPRSLRSVPLRSAGPPRPAGSRRGGEQDLLKTRVFFLSKFCSVAGINRNFSPKGSFFFFFFFEYKLQEKREIFSLKLHPCS